MNALIIKINKKLVFMKLPEICGLYGAVVNVADCYPRGAGFDSRVTNEFFPYVKEVEDMGLTNQP
jgi:hypothetical protein